MESKEAGQELSTGQSTTDADLGASEQQQEEEKHDGFIRWDKHQLDINAKTKKYHEERRGKEKAEAGLADLQKQFDEFKKTATAVELKPIDPFSETLAEDLEQRDKAIRQHNATKQ